MMHTVQLLNHYLELDGTVLKLKRYPSIQDIENMWLGLRNHFDISIVFEISVFEISKFIC